MPESERNAYIAQAFSSVSENISSPEEIWARQRMEHMINAKLAHNVNHR